MTEKLGRVNQELGDYKVRQKKLEESYELLQAEKQEIQSKFESADLENEMTKASNQTDFEKQLEVLHWCYQQLL